MAEAAQKQAEYLVREMGVLQGGKVGCSARTTYFPFALAILVIHPHNLFGGK